MTTEALRQALHMSEDRVRRLLGSLIRQGDVVVGRAEGVSISGYKKWVPTFRLKG
jgi:hypothetical protein